MSLEIKLRLKSENRIIAERAFQRAMEFHEDFPDRVGSYLGCSYVTNLCSLYVYRTSMGMIVVVEQ